MKHLLLLLILSIALMSCESKSGKLARAERVNALYDKIDSSQRVSEDGYPIVEEDPTLIPVSHPDKLCNHIVMDKTVTMRIDGHQYQRVLTYNYVDSVYQIYFLAIATTVGLTYQDTIHIAYPQYIKENY